MPAEFGGKAIYRLFYILSLTVAFFRDYFFPSDNLAELILAVFLLEAVVDVITRPLLQRSSNLLFNENYYFSTSNQLPIFISAYSAIIVLLAVPISSGWISSAWIIPCGLLMFTYRFSNIKLISFGLYNSYYFLELLKNIGLATVIVTHQFHFLALSLGVICFLQWYLARWKRLSAKQYHGKTTNLIVANLKSDFLLIFQIALSSSAFFLDKYLGQEDAGVSLAYVLITKYVVFSVSAFNVLKLQIFHLESRERLDDLTMRDIWAAGGPTAFLIVGGYLIFFFFVIDYLPVSVNFEFGMGTLFLGLFWLITMLAKEFFVRHCYMRADFKRYALVGIVSFLAYYCVLFVVGVPSIHYALILQSSVALTISLGLYFYVIREKTNP